MQNENKINENINVVGVKVLEQNGINVNEVIKQLVYNKLENPYVAIYAKVS